MKRLLLVSAVVASTFTTVAMPSFDPFADATGSGGTSYAVGAQLGHQTNALGESWAAVGTSASSSPVILVNSNLVYTGFPTGFPAPAGNAVQLTSATGPGGRLNLNRSVGRGATTTTIFASFLMKVANISGLSTTGLWFAGFNNTLGDQTGNPTTVASRIYLRRDTSTSTTYYVGVQNNVASGSGAAGVVWDAGGHTTNDVLFIVTDYEFNPGGSTLDLGRVWINPGSDTFGATTPPAGSLDYVGDGVTTRIWTYALLNRGTSEPKVLLVDELRVGDTWGFVTGGPGLASQPQGAVAGYSTTTNFQVSAISGSGTPLTYQWQKDGVPLSEGGRISGATTTNLTVASLSSADAGSYTVVVSNLLGTITSDAASLTVLDPYISVQPTNHSAPPGTTVSFSIAAAGTPTVSYQWRQNGLYMTDGVDAAGTTVSGSRSAHLVLSNLAQGDTGSTYDCVVENGIGGQTASAIATLTVFDPAITSQPQSRTNDYNTTSSFSVSAAGTGPFTYRWYKYYQPLADGGNVSGSGTSNLTLTGVSYLDAADYSVAVTNAAGGGTFSSAATLTVNDPLITTQPANRTVGAGDTATFTVGVIGSPSFYYQWYKGTTPLGEGGNITGVYNATLTITGVSSADAGSYSVLVTGGSGANVNSASATLTVSDKPSISSAPQPRKVRVGSNVGFVGTATGSAPISYQWSSNGVPIPGANSTTLLLTNVQLSTAATYSLTATNSVGSATAGAALTVTAGLLHLAPTNLVVARVGDGVQALTGSSGNTLQLDQFTTDGTYVSTIVIPDADASALIVDGSGNGGNSGSVLNLSANQRAISFAGYNVTRPYSAGSGTMSSDSGDLCPRGIGTVNGLGYYSLALSSTTLCSKYQFRSAVSTDGVTNFWSAGNGSGVKYVAPLIGPERQVSSPNSDPGGSPGNNRTVSIFNGNLYVSTAYGTYTNGLWRFDGIPTVRTDPVQITTNPAPSEFAVSPDNNTIYISDDSTIANGGGLQRWDNVGGAWTLTYTLGTGAGSTSGARGLAVDFSQFTGGQSGVGAVLYATVVGSSNNKLIRVVDNGSGSVPTVLATAGINQMFRGVRFGPVADPASVVTGPTSQTNGIGSTVLFSVNAGGSAPISYQWRRQGTNLVDGGNISGANTASLVLSTISAADAAAYSVVVTNDLGSQTSSTATLTVIASANPAHFNSYSVQPNGSFQMSLSGSTGVTYVVEVSTNLVKWTTLTNILSDTGTFQVTDPGATTSGKRFYRARWP